LPASRAISRSATYSRRLPLSRFANGLPHHDSFQPAVGAGVALRPQLVARHRQTGRDAGLIVDLDQDDRRPVANQLGRRRSARRLDAALRVDADRCQAERIEQLLQPLQGTVAVLRLLFEETRKPLVDIGRQGAIKRSEPLE